MDFTVPANHGVQLKENEEINRYLDPTNEKGCGIWVSFFLFNGISTFVGHLLPTLFSSKIEPVVGRIRGFTPFPGYLSERERNSATGVRTRLRRFRSPSLYPLHHEDNPDPWNMRVTVILIAVEALVMVPASFEKRLEELEIRGIIETIQTTAFLRLARIFRKVLETWGVFKERPRANAVVKMTQRLK